MQSSPLAAGDAWTVRAAAGGATGVLPGQRLEGALRAAHVSHRRIRRAVTAGQLYTSSLLPNLIEPLSDLMHLSMIASSALSQRASGTPALVRW